MAKIEINVPSEMGEYEDDLRFFFEVMVEKLHENAHKGKWEYSDLAEVVRKMQEEMQELQDAMIDGDVDGVVSESADLANFALILAMVCIKGTSNPFATTIKRGQALKFVEWAARQTEVDACILWPFKSKTGPNLEYGSLSKGQSRYGRRAHRVVCGIAHGEPPSERHHAAHLCGNSLCVNPKHIRWATPSQNQLDKRGHGTACTPVSLDPSRAEEMRKARAEGAGAIELSKKFGVSTTTVYNVVNRRTYKT